MKKALILLGALFVLTACPPPGQPGQPGQNSNTGLTVNRTDNLTYTQNGTKAAWKKGDVVFVFFKGVRLPKYMELKYDGKAWAATEKNGLSGSDLSAASVKKMTAVYLPYGDNAKLVARDTAFVFDGANCSWFLLAEDAEYSYDGKLAGTLDLKAPAPVTPGSQWVRVDVSELVSQDREYLLYNENLRKLSLDGVAPDGSVCVKEAEPFVGIPAAWKGVATSFYGVLDGSVLGQEVDYQFSLQDRDGCILHTYDAGIRKQKGSGTIDLGKLTEIQKWHSVEYVDLNLTNANGERLFWAKKNLGASVEKGEGSYGEFFFWTETEGHRLSGSFGSYSIDFKFNLLPAFKLDENKVLKPEYDAAHRKLGGLWRMPTTEEFEVLREGTVRDPYQIRTPESGMTLYRKDTKTVSLFLPAAGRVDSDTLKETGELGWYWSASGSGSVKGGFLMFYSDTYFYAPRRDFLKDNNNQAYPIRPVFSLRY